MRFSLRSPGSGPDARRSRVRDRLTRWCATLLMGVATLGAAPVSAALSGTAIVADINVPVDFAASQPTRADFTRVDFENGTASLTSAGLTLTRAPFRAARLFFVPLGIDGVVDYKTGVYPAMTGRFLQIDSGMASLVPLAIFSPAVSSATISGFARGGLPGTTNISFTWAIEYGHNDSSVIFNLKNKAGQTRTDTLSNCRSTTNTDCVAAWVPDSIWLQILNTLGDVLNAVIDVIPTYSGARISYTAPAGWYVESVTFQTSSLSNSLIDFSNSFRVDDLYFKDVSVSTPVDHLEITSTVASNLSCMPTTFTVKACANLSCSEPMTEGVKGTLSFGTSSGAFSIPAGSASTTVSIQVTSPPSQTAAISNLTTQTGGSVSGNKKRFCAFGGSATPSEGTCSFGVDTVGLAVAAQSQVAATEQTMQVSMLRASNGNPAVCTPAFVNTTKTFSVGCGYANPASPTLPQAVGVRPDAASSRVWLNAANVRTSACSGSTNVALRFDAQGKAPLLAYYADAGAYTLNLSYTGTNGTAEQGLQMTMSRPVTIVSAPAYFKTQVFDEAGAAVSPSVVLTAGRNYAVKVTAYAADNTIPPNFGRETPLQLPTVKAVARDSAMVSQADQTFSGVFSSVGAGVLASGNAWLSDEVGQYTIAATIAGYLSGSRNVADDGLTFHTFKPGHFSTTVTQQACGNVFTWAGRANDLVGQSPTVEVQALSARGTPTVNYRNAYARVLTFTADRSGTDALHTGMKTAPATAFGVGGKAVVNSGIAFDLPDGVAPTTVILKVSDADGVSTVPLAGYGQTEKVGTVALRRGRLELEAPRVISGNDPIQVTAQVTYFAGGALGNWVAAKDDACTWAALTRQSVGRSNFRNLNDGATAAFGSDASGIAVSGADASKAVITFPAPGSNVTGRFDMAVNLGSSNADAACTASKPATTGAGMPWLRTGRSCGAVTDPSTTVTIGIFSTSSGNRIHARENY